MGVVTLKSHQLEGGHDRQCRTIRIDRPVFKTLIKRVSQKTSYISQSGAKRINSTELGNQIGQN